MIKRIFNLIMARLGIDLILEHTIFRKVTKTAWYQGDGATLVVLLSIQIITGAILTLSYTNSSALAYQSVEFITHHQIMGWFIRGLHYWSSGLMVLMLIFHLFRLLLVGGYKSPREGTWVIGVFLFFLVIIMSFSGYVLRWDERAVYGVKVLLNILYQVPILGEELVLFVQGGNQINSKTLTRFFSAHVILVPAMLLVLVAYHLYLVILHGPTSKIESKILVKDAEKQSKLYERAKHSKSEGEDFFPETMAASGTMGFIVFMIGIILTLTIGPPDLYPEANLTRISYPQEEWWFWWYSSIIALLPPKGVSIFVVWFPILLFIFLISIPFLDRTANRGISNRPIWVLVVGISTIMLIGLSALRMRSPWTAWPSHKLPTFPKYHIITPELLEGRKSFVKYGCNSCHTVAEKSPKFAPDITEFDELLTRQHIKNYILSPPTGVAMPSYQGRMSEEELKFITEFVFVLQIQPSRK